MFSKKEFGIVSNLRFINMKISCSAKFYNLGARKCHNHEAQSTRGIKRRKNEEQIKKKQNATYETTDAQTNMKSIHRSC